MNRIDRIRAALEAALNPSQLQIGDDSELHAGHVGAGRGGHYRVEIIADAFRGKPPLARHRMVYAALADMMQSEIHALAISAHTPEEAGRH